MPSSPTPPPPPAPPPYPPSSNDCADDDDDDGDWCTQSIASAAMVTFELSLLTSPAVSVSAKMLNEEAWSTVLPFAWCWMVTALALESASPASADAAGEAIVGDALRSPENVGPSWVGRFSCSAPVCLVPAANGSGLLSMVKKPDPSEDSFNFTCWLVGWLVGCFGCWLFVLEGCCCCLFLRALDVCMCVHPGCVHAHVVSALVEGVKK